MMNEHEGREMMGLVRNNENLSAIVDDKNKLIMALKAANEDKSAAMDKLIKDCIEKDNKISKLERRVEFLEKWAEWNQKK